MDDLKWKKSRKSFAELRELLSCRLCLRLLDNPHLVGCGHSFCFKCVDLHNGEKCPICEESINIDLKKADENMQKLVDAYVGITKVIESNDKPKETLSLPAPKTTASEISNDVTSVGDISQVSTESSKPSDVPFRTPQPKKKLNGNTNLNNSSFRQTSTPASRINKKNPKGETPLHIACLKQGDLEKAKELLDLGANPNTQDNNGWTPLHEAVLNGNEEIVRLLLERGASPNIPGGLTGANNTPLHDAALCNKLNIVKLLISGGADTKARNGNGKTPVDLCSDEAVLNVIISSDDTIPVPPPIDHSRQAGQMYLIHNLNVDKKTMQRYSPLAKVLGFKVSHAFNIKVTHVLVKTNDPDVKNTTNFYTAVLQGQPLVDHQWLEDSLKENRLLDPSDYEIDGSLAKAPPGGSLARLNFHQQLPSLFNNCRFYLYGQFDVPSKNNLTAWIKSGGGGILTRSPHPEAISPSKCIPYHAKPNGALARCSHFILYANSVPPIKYSMPHLKALPVGWLLTCIENFALVDPDYD